MAVVQSIRKLTWSSFSVLAALLLAGSSIGATPQNIVVGNVRVQLLSDSLVRIELKGAGGFEDRKTFHIVSRDWPGAKFSTLTNSGVAEIRAADFVVRVPQSADSLDGISIASSNGVELYRYDGVLANSVWLPSPSDKPQAWSFADSPRMIPPPQGLTPPAKPAENGGWDLGNNAADIYVFLPRGDYFTLRRDFLKLTGPTEMPPLYEFGAFDSRWYDYSEATALKQIDDYRAHRIPLDVLVVDTGWRAGASTGYQANTNLFPNLPRFFSEAHAKNAKVLFNDHPQPLSTNVTGLEAKELNYRFNGLAGLLKDGLDIWWYDRNWYVALVPPEKNLRKEVWGMRLYHDTTVRVRPEQRPLIMANVDGIDNGNRRRPMDVAAHRFPFQWTGDIGPGWDYLRRGVENAVHAGVQSAFPYMSEDLGGHIANPTSEQYIRWIEYGALSPVYRPHCTHNLERMPWTFGPEAEIVARNFVNMRYRLLPVFYTAAHENYESGEPVLRRLDLDYPQIPEAARDDEYLLGKYILVAPVLQHPTTSSLATRATWIPPGDWMDAWSGKIVSGPTAVTNEVPLNQIPIWIKRGAVLPLAPEMQFTGEKPWSPVTLDIYAQPLCGNVANLYEDDTKTIGYQHGEFRNTAIMVSCSDTTKVVRVEIGAAKGNYSGALKKREWILRVHRPAGWPEDFVPANVTVNGSKLSQVTPVLHLTETMPFGDPQGAPDEGVFDIRLPSTSVGKKISVEISFGRPLM
jgi:hypothetical protein